MSIEDVLSTLNGFKRRRLIRDYAIMGGVASAVYMEPMFTEDIDILILTDSDEEFLQQYRAVEKVSEGVEGMHLIIAGTPVQLFPSVTKPLYDDALRSALKVRVGNVRTKVVSVEHLILMMLEADRPKDRARVSIMLDSIDRSQLRELLRRFDDKNGTLAHRLEAVSGESLR